MKLFLLIFFMYNSLAYAQDSLIYRDSRIDSLIKKQIQINEATTRDSRRNIPGYRIQVANSNDRNQVFAIKTRIYQTYPELKPYLIYQPPNYKLKVGNFRTPDEADPYLQKLTRDYPSGVYLVHDIIEVKPD
jgi:SPOR domain